MPAASTAAQPARPNAIQFVPRAAPQGDIQIGPQIFAPDVTADSSNMVSNDDTCIISEDEDTG